MKALLLAISLMFVSCSSAGRTTASLVGAALSSAIVTAGSCEGVDVVKADVQSHVDSWFKLNAPSDSSPAGAQKAIVQNLCKLAIESVAPSLLGATLKADWKCKLTTIQDASKVLSSLACSSISI